MAWPGGLLDGVEDAHVAGAAAEVSGEAFLNLVERWLGILIKQVVGGEDHAGSADTALGSAFFEEALLDRMEVLLVREPFDCGDVRALGLQDGDEAGVDQLSIHEDGAGAAFAFAAAFLGTGEVEVLAEDVKEALHRWGV